MGPPDRTGIVQLLDQLQGFADRLSLEDHFLESGLVLTARQTIRALFTKLSAPATHPAPPPPPSSPEEVPGA